MSEETNAGETMPMAQTPNNANIPFASNAEWKRYALSAAVPLLIAGVWLLLSDSGVPLLFFVILAIRSVVGLAFMLSHCQARSVYLSRHPNESDYCEVNKNVFSTVLKNRKPMTAGDPAASVPGALESLWLRWRGRWIRHVFSVSPHFLEESISTYLKEKFPEQAPLPKTGKPEDVKTSAQPTAESEFTSFLDYLALKKFILSDILPGLWLLLSIGDVYILIKLYGNVLSEGWLIGLIIASLIVIRIVSEYTAVLFSIATLAREIRNELRVANEIRRQEPVDAK